MLYIHDEKNRFVYSLPEEPTVNYVKGKKGDTGTWRVSTSIEVTRADNFTDPATGRRRFDLRYRPWDEYFEFRDSKEEAVAWFKSSNYPDGERITAEEYVRLVGEYERLAKQGIQEAQSDPGE